MTTHAIADREDALRALLAACRAGARTVLVSGSAGAGKTWLVEHARDALAAERCSFVGWGRYAEGEQRSDFAPVLTAVSGPLRQAMARFYDEQAAIASISEAMGGDLEVLLRAGLSAPTLAPADGAATGRQSARRMVVAVARLLRWIGTLEVPIVLFVDDWRRAPPEVRDLFARVDRMVLAAPLTLVLTQREGADGTPDARQDATKIALAPLHGPAALSLLGERIGDEDAAALIAAALGDALPRLPFDILQLADALLAAGALRQVDGAWQVDVAAAGALAYDAPAQVAALPGPARQLAVALGLWGDGAPVGTLLAATAAGEDAVSALEASGVAASAAGRLSFRHDRFRSAALDQVPVTERRRVAGALAEACLPAADPEQEAAALSLRLLGGLEDLDSAAEQASRWRDRFAAGARAARMRGASAAAGSFAEAALHLHRRVPATTAAACQLIEYEGLLAASHRDDPATLDRARALVASATTASERFDFYEAGAVALRFAGQGEAAWSFARDGLAQAGIHIPQRRGAVGLAVRAAALRWWWHRHRERRMPVKGGVRVEDFTGMAAAAAEIAYHRDPRLTALIAFEASRRSSEATRHTPYWSSINAFLLSILGDPASAAAEGARAVAHLAEQPQLRATTLYQAVFFGTMWRRRLADERPRFREVTQLALAEGDLTMAAYSIRNHIMAGWRTAESLDTLLAEATVAARDLAELGEESFCAEMQSMVELLEGLTGKRPWSIELWRRDIDTRNHVIDLELAALAGDWTEVVRRAAALRPIWRDYDLQSESVPLRFYRMLGQLRTGTRPSARDVRFLKRAAELNPFDHAAKLRLIAAECARLDGRADQDAYARAVDAAAAGDCRLLEGVAAECAAAAATSAATAERWHLHAQGVWERWHARARLAGRSATEREGAALDRERADAAERAVSARARLAAHAAHELRTPLQALQTLLDVAGDDRAALDLAATRGVVASLTRIVDDFDLLASEREAASGGGEPGVDLGELLRSEAAVWSTVSAVAVSIPPVLPPLDLPEFRVRQVVRNLLSNAVRYGQREVGLSLTAESDGARSLRVMVTVEDRGAGLSPAALRTIFEPFDRGDHEGDRRGTGLGLTLSRRIADRLGGTLTAANRSGGGARFTLSFPATVADKLAIASAHRQGAAVLLVEDSPLIRSLVATILQRAGHRVTEAGRADAAITALAGRHFDAVVLDLGLPDASGLEVARAVRERSAQTAIVVLTAAMDAVIDDGSPDPRRALLRKPASAEQLLDTLAGMLGLVPALPAPANDDGIAALYASARDEVISQGRRWIDQAPEIGDQPALHRFAGMAAQFGFGEIAAAAEGIERDLRAGLPVQPALDQLARSLDVVAA